MRNMKFWKPVLSLALILLMNNINLSANNDKKPDSITEQITLHLESMDQDNIPNGTEVMVDFMVNGRAEIIVLATNDSELDYQIKNCLNYKKVSAADLQINTTYSIPLLFKKQ